MLTNAPIRTHAIMAGRVSIQMETTDVNVPVGTWERTVIKVAHVLKFRSLSKSECINNGNYSNSAKLNDNKCSNNNNKKNKKRKKTS